MTLNAVADGYKFINHLEIGMGIVLFSKFWHLTVIALLKIPIRGCFCQSYSESKVLQLFGNEEYSWAALYIFANFVKVNNYTGLRDAELTWYSPRATHQICLQGLEHSLWIHDLRTTWYCPIVEVLATWAKFFLLYGYSNVINCVFVFPPTNIFGCFIAQFKLVKNKFPNLTTLLVHLTGFQIKLGMKQLTICQRTNYPDITNSGYLSQLERLP